MGATWQKSCFFMPNYFLGLLVSRLLGACRLQSVHGLESSSCRGSKVKRIFIGFYTVHGGYEKVCRMPGLVQNVRSQKCCPVVTKESSIGTSKKESKKERKKARKKERKQRKKERKKERKTERKKERKKDRQKERKKETSYGEQGPAKLSRHKAAKPLNLDHAAKPRSHKATWRHSLTGASQRHKAAKLQKTPNVVEFESRDTLACMAGHEPRFWCFSSLWRFETL